MRVAPDCAGASSLAFFSLVTGQSSMVTTVKSFSWSVLDAFLSVSRIRGTEGVGQQIEVQSPTATTYLLAVYCRYTVVDAQVLQSALLITGPHRIVDPDENGFNSFKYSIVPKYLVLLLLLSIFNCSYYSTFICK